MKIAFDSQAFRMQRHGGISRYLVWLADNLHKLGADVRIVAPVHRNAHLAAAPTVPHFGMQLPVWMQSLRVEGGVNWLLESMALAVLRPDVFHATYYAETPRGRGTASVLTVHDMVHERFADWHPGNPILAIKAAAVRRADHVICISRATQHDLCDMLDYPVERTSVVHHGGSQLSGKGASPLPAGLRRPYILFVGQRFRHKNFDVLLQAFGRSARIQRDHQLVAFGGTPFSDQEMALARGAGIAPDALVQLAGDDEALAAAYFSAAAFVYPSLYEGFGMPLLEAMALGCPVVSSRTSCMPEIAGDAALYFDPGDADELVLQLERVLDDQSLRQRLIASGFSQERKFSWQSCAKQTMAAYTLALGGVAAA